MVLYHNPRCSKSRAALMWLQETGIDVTVVDYQQTPLNADELRHLARCLGVNSWREMMRCDDDAFGDLGLHDADEAALLAALLEQPKLLQRPILLVGERAVIGRPLDNIQALLR